jgi:hypothetical protein
MGNKKINIQIFLNQAARKVGVCTVLVHNEIIRHYAKLIGLLCCIAYFAFNFYTSTVQYVQNLHNLLTNLFK